MPCYSGSLTSTLDKVLEVLNYSAWATTHQPTNPSHLSFGHLVGLVGGLGLVRSRLLVDNGLWIKRVDRLGTFERLSYVLPKTLSWSELCTLHGWTSIWCQNPLWTWRPTPFSWSDFGRSNLSGGVWYVTGGCLPGGCQVFEKIPGDVWKVSRKCLKIVWKIPEHPRNYSVQGVFGSKHFLDPKFLKIRIISMRQNWISILIFHDPIQTKLNLNWSLTQVLAQLA